MQYKQGVYPIQSVKNLTADTFDFIVHCPDMAALAQPGQFVHIRVAGFTLRRPISICGIDTQAGNLRLVFQIRGKGTEKMAALRAGDTIDLLGPLGNGFSIDRQPKDKKVWFIGGGIGVPPLLEAASHYRSNATAILGFRSIKQVILEEDFCSFGCQTLLATDDGSAGRKGFVTDILDDLLAKGEKPEAIYCCGPEVMLKKVAQIALDNKIFCQVSLEARMGCGVGACLVCACKAKHKDGEEYFAHVCKDGPVFNAEEIIFE